MSVCHFIFAFSKLSDVFSLQTGKSSIINSLAQKDTVPVYALSASAQAWDTTTTRAYEVDVPQKNIILIDTPGLSFHNDKKHDEDVKVRDILIRRRGRVDKVKEPIPPGVLTTES